MVCSALFSLLALSSVVNALPGRREALHQHHRRADVTVYQTVVVTEWHTATAADTTPTAAAAVAANVPTTTAPVAGAATTLQTVATQAVAAAPAASSNAAAAASVIPSGTTATSTFKSSGSKRGLAWPSDNAKALEAAFAVSSSPLSWYFNWGTGSTDGLSSLSHIFQQWGSDNLHNLASLPYGSVVLGFNEPDGVGQAAMSPSQAAAIYRSNLTPLRKTGQISYLGSPGITNGPGGIGWLTEFMSLCSDCEIDFISAHWYGPTMSLLQSQLTAIHTAFGKPVWLTEFACTNWVASTNPSASDIYNFMGAALSWLDSQSWIEKYAWFGALIISDTALGAGNMLVTSDGSSLSALGKLYMT